MNTFPRPTYRRTFTGTAAVGIFLLIVAVVVGNVALVAWIGMVLAGVLGITIGYGKAVVVAALGMLLLGLLAGNRS